ncbi:MAG: thioesterase family protein [Clostridia bacterium]|nr:thioesterase family protein [Clostridia bacterium]
MIKKGMTADQFMLVTEKDTASSHGSGTVNVLATPAMVALMEKAAVSCVEEHLEAGQTTVGTGLEIKHLSPTPVGVEVGARATVCRVEGRLITFHVEAWDNRGKIGEGMHTRFVVDEEGFLARAYAKKKSGED